MSFKQGNVLALRKIQMIYLCEHSLLKKSLDSFRNTILHKPNMHYFKIIICKLKHVLSCKYLPNYETRNCCSKKSICQNRPKVSKEMSLTKEKITLCQNTYQKKVFYSNVLILNALFIKENKRTNICTGINFSIYKGEEKGGNVGKNCLFLKSQRW